MTNVQNTQPTQVQHHWRAVVRTAFQVLVAAVPVVGLSLVLFNDVINEYALTLPPEVAAWIAGTVVLLTAASAFVSKLMANPQVNAFIDKYLPWLRAE